MSDNKKHKHTCCPYWSLESRKCTIQREGLFIPMDDHVEIYCTTKDYSQCLQYNQQTTSQLLLIESTRRSLQNRRQHERFELHQDITLVKLFDTDHIVRISTNAKTLDMSKAGMRLSLETPLQSDGLIRFSFDDVHSDQILTGKGHIAWCNKQIDEPGYQAGVVFEGGKLVKAIGTFIESLNASM